MVTRTSGDRQGRASRQRAFLGPVAGLALATLTVALRLWHVRHGLPDFLEEALPFKKAFEMWGWQTGRTDLNPHFFHYPTLSLYVHFGVQKFHYLWGHLHGLFATPADYWLLYQLDPSSQVIAARLIGILADLATVLAVWTMGERLRRGAGLLAGILVAFAATMILTARSIYADSLMAALGTWALERLLAYLKEGGRQRLIGGIVLIGLAAGAKYTAGLLVLPLAWVMWCRRGKRGLRDWPLAAGACLLVFILCSPYVVADFGEFWSDFNFERRHMAEGHLGSLGEPGGWFQLQTAGHDLGWAAVALLLASLAIAVRKWHEEGARPLVAIWLFLLPNVLSVAFFRMEASRYLLPILPPVAVLCTFTLAASLRSWPSRTRRLVTLAAVGVVLVPPVRAGWQAAGSGGQTTQQLARLWCESHLDRQQLLVQEHYGAILRNEFEREQIRRHPCFQAASDSLRQRFLAAPWFRSVLMPMATSGQYTIVTGPAGAPRRPLRVFPHASDINKVFYEPALWRGVDFALVSGAVRQRYEQDPERYARQLRFYRLLAENGELAAHFAPGAAGAGPEVTIYRLGERFQRRLQDETRPLDALWWAADIPAEFRRRSDDLLAPEDAQSLGAVWLPSGQPALWVRALAAMFDQYIQPFLLPLAFTMAELGRNEEGLALATAVLIMVPDQEHACLVYSQCSTELGRWERARQAVAGSLALLQQRGDPALRLRLEHARILQHLGQQDAASAELQAVIDLAPPGSRTAQQARRMRAEEEGPAQP